jgi:L-iditol 2-dehydrogenase
MRAALSYGRPDQVRIESLPDPVPGPGEVVCDVLACGVCATDVIDWYVTDRLPAVLGHEPVGVVAAVGPDVAGIAAGNRVVLHHHAPCGECRRCQRGHETMCEHFRASSLRPGGFAERVLVPAELVGDLLALPAALDPATATLVEPLACVLRAQDRAGLHAGDSLLVLGAGVNGLLQIASAHERGVEAVWVREPRVQRLAVAESFGAEQHGNEPVDIAIVCTPAPEAITTAAAALAPGGTLCLYAPPDPGLPLPIPGTEMFVRELTVTASYSATRAEMVRSLALLADGRIDADRLVTHRFGLDQTGAALAQQRAGDGLKLVVLPGLPRDAPGTR